MSTEVLDVREKERKFRRRIPDAHRHSLDTRLAWLFDQRFGTVQTVWQYSPDVLDKTAATMILQAILAEDLNNIALVFRRLEGGSQVDTIILDESMRI